MVILVQELTTMVIEVERGRGTDHPNMGDEMVVVIATVV